MSYNTLDVGCGNAKAHGAIGIDSNPNTQADIVHDLNMYPWPLETSAFDTVIINHVVEHVSDMIRFMEEVNRVSKPKASVSIITPHFSNRFSYTDPTHLRHLSMRSFDYFAVKRMLNHNLLTRFFETQFAVPDFYMQPLFHITKAQMSFARPFRYTGISYLANKFPDFYELYLAFVLPARDLYFTLEVIK